MSKPNLVVYEVDVDASDVDGYRKMFAEFDDAYRYLCSRVSFFSDGDGGVEYEHNHDDEDEILAAEGAGVSAVLRCHVLHTEYDDNLVVEPESIDAISAIERGDGDV